MTTNVGQPVRCRVVGEYVDYGAVPALPEKVRDLNLPRGEVDRPRIVAEFVEAGSSAEELRQFKVLLRDKREVTVCGHSLEHVPGKESPEDPALYRVVIRSGDRDILVALFRASEVTGIFCGDLREACESA